MGLPIQPWVARIQLSQDQKTPTILEELVAYFALGIAMVALIVSAVINWKTWKLNKKTEEILKHTQELCSSLNEDK